jgi:serine/threonine protein kinase
VAEDTSTCWPEEVAVKGAPKLDEEHATLARTEHEFLRMLEHPSIVKVMHLVETPHDIWLFMEFCSRGPLDVYVETNGALADSCAKHLSYQLIQGINYLHRKRIVHMDIKPANLLLKGGNDADQLTLKIADFNSAKRLGSSAAEVLSARCSPFFSAPEYRFAHTWNERVDVWGCGLSSYFMLTAKFPFSSNKALKKAFKEMRLCSVSWDGCTHGAKSFTEQCLTVKMEDRPPPMELLLHPWFANQIWEGTENGTVFGPSNGSSKECNSSSKESRTSLKECARNSAGSKSSCGALSWKERRRCEDWLHRLMENRCRRLQNMNNEPQQDVSNGSEDSALVLDDYFRQFSTPAATGGPDGEKDQQKDAFRRQDSY